MHTKTRNRIIVLVVLIVLALVYWLIIKPQGVSMSGTSIATSTAADTNATNIDTSSDIQAMFVCTDGKAIGADFATSTVTLNLSDGRTLVLPRALSADGARYANADESFVFWNKGEGAFIQENGTTTYDGCTAQTAEQEN